MRKFENQASHPIRNPRRTDMADPLDDPLVDDPLDYSSPAIAAAEFELSDAFLRTEKMASLGKLVTGVAHEINNPVNFIYGNLSYADRYMQELLKLVAMYRQALPESSPQTPIEITHQIQQMDLDFVMEDFPKIQSSMQLGASRIYDIVQALSTFSHSDERHTQKLDLHHSIDSTLTILKSRIKGAGDRPEIIIEKKLSPQSEIECYAGRINQVMINLVSNAIDAIEAQFSIGAPSADWVPRIIIATFVDKALDQTADHDWMTLKITDSGCGMSSEVQSQIFNPFFTTKAMNRGTGLGLAICQKIILHDHQGTFECESLQGGGTTFTLRLPLRQPSVTP